MLLIPDFLLHFLVERPTSYRELLLTLTALVQVWRSGGVCSDDGVCWPTRLGRMGQRVA